MSEMKGGSSGESSGTGLRYNSGKIRWSLMSIHALRELINVLEFGAKKYALWNWSKGLSWTECYDSLQRHATAWLGGEDKDPETGLSHIAHVLCNAMFLVHFIVTGTGTDDRPSAQRKQEGKEIGEEFTSGCGNAVVKCGVLNVQTDILASNGSGRCY